MNSKFKKVGKITLKVLGGIVGLLLLAFIGFYAWVKLGVRYDISPAAYHWEKNISKTQVDSIAQNLLSQMSLEEKVDQMTGDSKNLYRVFAHAAFEKRLGLAYAGRNDRLDIPPIAFSDGPRGVVAARGTCFPVSMARGATWDKALENRVGDAIGKEARAVDVNYFGGLCINLLRHPSWGRAQETYGEDPWLLGEMGLGLMNGVQHHNVMACAKHLACNSIENSRFYVDVQIDDRTLHEVYLPHFKKTADNGVASMMSAYNKVNGKHAGHSHELLTGILRDEWKWDGFITSDWINGIRDGELAAKAGMDIEMPTPADYGENLVKLVNENKISVAEIDTMVLRILKKKLWYVTRKDPMKYDKSLVGSKANIDLAREVAEKGMVLLKNENNVLPFKKEQLKKIAVIGKLADVENTGDQGSSIVQAKEVITPLEGLENYLGDDVEILFSDGEDIDKAIQYAKEADAVIIVAGYEHSDEGEYINMGEKGPRTLEQEMETRRNKKPWQYLVGGDRLDLNLKERDLKVINAVGSVNKNTVVSVICGSAFLMEDWKDKVSSILIAWYPGMEGGNALANVLFGKVNPSGKLPFTMPKSEDQLPYFDAFKSEIDYGYYHGYTLFDKKKQVPSYPFGFGLSYTTFKYDSLKVQTPAMGKSDLLKVSVDLKNTGKLNGEEVTQLYIGFKNSSIDRPVKLLRGFKKVALKAGEGKTITFEVQAKDLAWYNPENKQWEIEEMEYEVYVGNSSSTKDLIAATFMVNTENEDDK